MKTTVTDREPVRTLPPTDERNAPLPVEPAPAPSYPIPARSM